MIEQKTLNHIGFIMDGNRTWAKNNGLPQLEGHRKGYDNVENIIKYCLELHLPYVSFWGLSDDNIKKRSEQEVKYLFDLLVRGIDKLKQQSKKKNIRLHFIGNRSLLREDCKNAIEKAEDYSKNHTGMQVIFALGYGGQDEIIRTIIRMAKEGIDMEKITPEDFQKYSDTGVFPPPDLIVRSGGHMRHSGYFLFQSAYSEYAFSEKNWPDFDKIEFTRIIEDFESRLRKFGK